MNPPAALQSAMGRERKPFTYTPGGIDLTEIKSEKMARRLMRNAMNPGVQEVKASPQTPTSPTSSAPMFMNLPVQVFPNFSLPANPKSLLRSRSNPDGDSNNTSVNGRINVMPNQLPYDERKKENNSLHRVRFEDELLAERQKDKKVRFSNGDAVKESFDPYSIVEDKINETINKVDYLTGNGTIERNNETNETHKEDNLTEKIKCNGDISKNQKADSNNNEAEVTIKLSTHQTQQSSSQQTKTVNVTKKVTIKETEEEEEEEIEEVEEEEEYEEEDEVEEDKSTNVHNVSNKAKIVEITEVESKEQNDSKKAVEEEEKSDVEEEYEDAEKEEEKIEEIKKEEQVVQKQAETRVETEEEEIEEVEEEEEYEEEEEEEAITDNKVGEILKKVEETVSKTEIKEPPLSSDSGDKVVQHTVESETKNADASTVTKKETTEITTSSKVDNEEPHVTKTEFRRTEETTTTETRKTVLQNDGLTKEEAVEKKVFFPPIKHEVIESSIKQETSSNTDEDSDRRHSLLLERLSVERQLPSAILQSKLTSKNVTAKKQLFTQENTTSPSSYHYKPQSLWNKEIDSSSHVTNSETSQQTYNQTNETFSSPQYVNPSEPTYVPAQQSYVPSQPKYEPPEPKYAPPEPKYAPPEPKYAPPEPTYASPPQQSYYPPQQTYEAPQQMYVPPPQTFAPKSNTYAPPVQNYEPIQPSYLSQQSVPDYSQPQSYVPPSQQYNNYSNTYNQSTYQQSNDNYTQSQQIHSGYVPPPWVNDPQSPSEAFVPQPMYPTKPTKQPPLAYIPPPPNAAFNKPIKGTKTPKTKTYYSEYERRYISVPETNYVPQQESQPSWVHNKFNDSEEVVEDSELPWRKELRELQERTNSYATERQESISKPEWQENLKQKTFSPVEAQEQIEQPWRKELRELREQKSYSMNVDDSRPSWCEEQTSTITRTEKDGQAQEERSFSTQVTRPPWEKKVASSPLREQTRFSQDMSKTQWQDSNQYNSWTPNTRPASYMDTNKTRPLSNYIKSRMNAPQNRVRGVSVDRYVSSTYQSPYSTMPDEDYSLPWEGKQSQTTDKYEQSNYQLPWENPGYKSAPTSAAPPSQANDYQFTWEQPKSRAPKPQPAYHTLPRMHSEHRERTPARSQTTPQRSFGQQREQPVQSRSFKYLQMLLGTEDGQEEVDFVMQPPKHSQERPWRI